MALLTTAACSPAETGKPGAVGATSSSTPAPTGGMVLPPGMTASPTPDAGDGPTTAPELPTEKAPLGDTVAFDTGISVVIDSVKPITVKAQTPGEVSGPAVVVIVKAKNGTNAAQSLDSAVVTVAADDGEPGVGTTAGSPQPLSGTIKPGQTATGRYVFMLGSASGRAVTVTVNYAAGEPVAVFTGKVS